MAATQPRRWRRWIAIALSAVFGGALWWATSSATAVHWMAASLVQLSAGTLVIENPGGSLLGRLHAERVLFESDGLRVEALQPVLSVSTLSLFKRSVVLGELSAETLRLRLPASEAAPQFPVDLKPPLAIEIQALRLPRLELDNGGETLAFTGIRAALQANGDAYRIEHLQVQTPWAAFDAQLNLATRTPFALDGRVQINTGSTAPAATDATITLALGGDLRAPQAALSGRVAGAALSGRLTLAPFAAAWLDALQLNLAGLDIATLQADLPRSALKAALSARMNASGGFNGQLHLDNALPGRPAAQRLPLRTARSDFAYSDGVLTLRALQTDLGEAGRLAGDARVTADGSRWRLRATALDLHGLHDKLRPTQLAGLLEAHVDARGQSLALDLHDASLALQANLRHEGGVVRLRDAQLQAGGGKLNASGELTLAAPQTFALQARIERLNPAAFGDWPAALLNAGLEAHGRLQPAPAVELSAKLTDSRWRGVALSGEANMQFADDRLRNLKAALALGANRLRVNSEGGDDNLVQWQIDAAQLAQLDPHIGGRLFAHVTTSGPLKTPAVRFKGSGEALQFQKTNTLGAIEADGAFNFNTPDAPLQFTINARQLRAAGLELASLQANGSGRLDAHQIELRANGRGLNALARLQGGWQEPQWRGTLTQLENRGDNEILLAAPATLKLGRAHVNLADARLRAFGGLFNLDELRYEQSAWRSRGSLRAVAAMPILTVLGVPVAAGSNLLLRGDWTLAMTPRLNGRLQLERESGDLALGAAPAMPLGLASLQLGASAVEDEIDATANLDSGALGRLTASAHLGRDPSAPAGVVGSGASLSGTLQAALGNLKALNGLIGGGVLLDGRASATLKLAGTLGAPLITGNAQADGVRLDLPAYGIALREGRARIVMDERRINIEALRIEGAEGALEASGTLLRDDATANMVWRADRLRIFNRPDRRLVVSGKGSAALLQNRLALRGELRADEGYLEFQRTTPGRLSDDIKIIGRKTAPAAQARAALPLELDIGLDAGERLQIFGAGLDTGLRGKLKVNSETAGNIKALGTIETTNGNFYAYGQKLVIERGRLYFDGAIDNPGLDILALRKNQAVEAGVEVSGTVKTPRVVLVSNPAVADNEKLAWLVLGRDVQNATGADYGLLQAAGGFFSNNNAPPLSRQIARSVGFDETTIRGASGGAEGQVLAIGKRLSDQVYLEYEQGITTAANVVRLSLALTRRLSLRAETNQRTSGFGLSFQRAFD